MRILLLLLPFSALIGCVKHSKTAHMAYGMPVDGILITKAQYGQNWPFLLDSLYLFRGEKSDVYVERMDTIYAVNNIASDMADSGEFGGFQQWHLIVKNPIIGQIKAKEEIKLLGLKQWVNKLNRH